jgi:RHS repeat-associated protein
MVKRSKEIYLRRLRCEELEDRRLLSIGMGKVVLSNAVDAGNMVGDIAVDANYVYWAEGALGAQNPTMQIKRVGINGGAATVLATDNQCINGWSFRIVLDNTDIYFVDGAALYRVSKNGGAVTFISDQFGYDSDGDTSPDGRFPSSLAIDPTLSLLYVGNYTPNGTGSVQMIPKTGGTVTNIATGLTYPSSIATTATAVYWTTATSVSHAPLSGGTITTDLPYNSDPMWAITSDSSGSVFYADEYGRVSGILAGSSSLTAFAGNYRNDASRGLAADGSKAGNLFYTASDNTIRYVPKTKLPAQTTLVTGLSSSGVDICIAGNYLYYSEAGSTPSINKIPIPAGPPASFKLTAPTSGSYLIGQNVTIKWTAANVADGSTVSLCYDKNSTWDGNEKWITANQMAAADGTASYTWNTAGLAAGTYYIGGYLYSGGKAYLSHLTSSFTVKAPSFTLTAPTSGAIISGKNVAIQWTVANLGMAGTISLCYDKDTKWNGNEKWIETDAVVAANGTATYTWTTTGLTPGIYYVGGYLWSGGKAYMSHLTSSFTVKAPSFTMTAPASGTINSGQDVSVQWTIANLGLNGTVSLCYDKDTTWNGNEKWIEVDAVAAANGKAAYTWNTLGLASGTYYVAGYLYSGGKAYMSHLTTSITVKAPVRSFNLTGPVSGTFAAGITVPINWTATNVGAASTISLCYDADTTWWNGNEHWIEVDQVAAANGARSYSWDTTGVAPGTYYVGGYLYSGGKVYLSHLSRAITVVGAAAGFESHLIVPADVAQGNSRTIYVEYSNQGTTTITAPLVMVGPGPTISNSGVLFTLDQSLANSTSSQGYFSCAQVLASGQTAGFLNPGESITVPVCFYNPSVAVSDLTFSLLSYNRSNTSAVGWSSLQASMQPEGMSTTAWNALFTAVTAQTGTTWGDYVRLLDNNASYLGQLGERITDATQLWQFALEQADGLTPRPQLSSVTDLAVTTPALNLDFSRIYNEPISCRDQFGPLGYGWRESWQYSLVKSSDGTITVTMPSGAMRAFAPTSSSTYSASSPGDYATLQAVYISGTLTSYHLVELDGQQIYFNANGRFAGLYDASLNNGIVAGYNGSGQMTSLTQQSSGKSLAISYYTTGNGAGLISSVASSDGRTVHYSYDASGHLTSVQSYDGQTTTYSYDNSSNAATQNALTAITPPSGPTTSFAYTATGQLSAVTTSGGQSQVVTTYSYLPCSGKVNVSDAAGNVSQYFFDAHGLLLKAIDPLGNVSSATYDSDNNVLSTTGPTNLTATFTYDSQGNLLSSTNSLGQTVTFTYGSLDRMTSTTDSKGNTTTYSYDAAGNLLSITNPAGGTETATYNAQGNPLTLLNPNGQTVTYTYNSAGQPTKQTLADGSVTTFAYDSRGNLATAVGATGITTLSYDSGDRLTKVAYPNGRFLAYTYDAAGRRTQMVDQSGFTVNYAYNSLGLLSTLTDGTGATIIAYTYGSLGELAREDKGNGTYTTYQYDANGNVLHLVNYSPSGTVDSRFDYTYNALGERTTMTTLDGKWTYGYDQVGQLTSAVFASTNPAVSSQNLTYAYDANGNRTQTVINGVTTSYTTNNLDEYTAVGTTTYQYDADGNLVKTISGSSTTTYAYDSLDRLVGMTTPTDTWSYSYNALNERIGTTHNGQSTSSLIDPTGLGNVVGTYNNSGTLVANYTYGLGLVSQVVSGTPNYYDFDAIGSTVGLTSSSGAILNTYAYLPFGTLSNSTGTTANPFTFVGQLGVSQDGSGLLDMRNRSYDATLGQFLSNDPLGAAGDMNLRRYAANNPISLVDPVGLAAYIFDVRAGRFYGIDGTVSSRAYAGRHEGLNNPDMQAVHDMGPLPTGTYTLGANKNRHKAADCFRLTPSPGTDTMDRGGFWIHRGNFRQPPGNSSKGCICLPDEIRQLLRPGDTVTVVPGYRPAAAASTGVPNSKVGYDVSGNVLAPVIAVGPNPMLISASVGATSVMTNFTVTNNGSIGSTLIYGIQGSLSGGSMTFSKSPSSLDCHQYDDYVVTMTVSGGFLPGHTYSGTIIVSTSDPVVSVKKVTVPVTITVPSPTFTLTGPTSGTYTAGQTVTIQWTTGNIIPGSTVSLCYDKDATFNNNETWIEVKKAPATNNGYSWNTTGVATGKYYIGGYLFCDGKYYYYHIATPITIVGKAGPYQVVISQIVGSGYVTDDTKQIDTRVGKYAGTYNPPDTGSHWLQGGYDAYFYNAVTGAYLDWMTYFFDSSTPGISSGLNVKVVFSGDLLADVPAAQSTTGTANTLTQDALAPVVAEAIARWQATGLSTEEVTKLTTANVQIVDLPGTRLGSALPDRIQIDKDAAGYGWFVDPTPHDDDEFTQLAAGTLAARTNTAADQRADLLTVVMHELGHLLGCADDTAGDLMNGTLPLGVRRTLPVSQCRVSQLR